MKINWSKRSTVRLVSNLIVVAFGIVLFFLLGNITAVAGAFSWVMRILAPFLFGFVFSYILNAPMMFFEKLFLKMNGNRREPKKRLIRVVSIILSILILFIILGALIYIILPRLIESITGLVKNANGYFESVKNAIYNFLTSLNISSEYLDGIISRYDDLISTVASLLQNAIPNIISFSKEFTTSIYNFFIGLIMSFYILYSKETFFAQIKKLLYAFFKKPHVEKFLNVAHEANRAFTGFFYGKIIDSIIIGVICYIGMLIFRMPYAPLIASLIGIANIIPYIGPFIGAIPSILIIFIVSPIKALWFLIFIVLLQQFDGNFLSPRILGNSIGLSSFWVLFAIIIGGGIAGLAGMFLGVPIFAVLYSFTSVFIENRLAKKGLPVPTSEYYLGDAPVRQKRSSKAIDTINSFLAKIFKKKKNPEGKVENDGK